MAPPGNKSIRKRRNCDSRVRSGCQSCKNRRIKCDESRPTCLKCSTSGWPCIYSDPWRHIWVANESKNSISPQLSLDTHFGIPLDALGRSYFYYFRHHASKSISSMLSVSFWNSFVLPMSVGCEAVQHAIIALATQYRTWSDDNLMSLSTKPSTVYSLASYGKAIRSLNVAISKEEAALGEILVTCLLLICYNVLQGNDRDALMHLEAGLRIYKKYPSLLCSQSPAYSQMSQDEGQQPMLEMEMNFRRLDVQAAWNLGAYQLKSNPTFEITSSLMQQQHFSCITHAREVLHELTHCAVRFMRSTAEAHKYSPHSSPGRTGIARERDTHLALLSSWVDSFQRFLSNLSTPLPARSFPDTSRLWLCYHSVRIALSVCLSPSEMAYDSFFPDFSAVIHHAAIILASQRTTPFDLHTSLIHPLYITAIKCRFPIRFEALSLLHQCGKEGVFDSKIFAKIAAYVVSEEEARRCTVGILERDRISGVGLNIMRAERRVLVQCNKKKWKECLEDREGERADGEDYNQEPLWIWEFSEEDIFW